MGALTLAALIASLGDAMGLAAQPLSARVRCSPPRMDFEFPDQPAVATSQSGQQGISPLTAPLRQVFSSAELQRSLTDKATGALTVVLFGSKSCAACRAVLSRLRQLDHTLEQVQFLHLNLADETREAFLVHEITHMPMAYVYDAHGSFIESHLCLRSGLRDFRDRLYKLLAMHEQHVESSAQTRISFG